MRRTKAGDGINNQERIVTVGTDQFGDPFHVVARAGGAFSRLHIHGTSFGRKFDADFVQRKRLAIRLFQNINSAAVGLGQIAPAFAEFPGGEHQDAVPTRSEV